MTETTYRETVLPGLGRLRVPAHLSDAEVLEQLNTSDPVSTPPAPVPKKD